MKVKILNKENKKTFTLNIQLNERELVESCINYYFSGYDCLFILFFYALQKRWNVDKLIYYTNLIKKLKKEKEK